MTEVLSEMSIHDAIHSTSPGFEDSGCRRFGCSCHGVYRRTCAVGHGQCIPLFGDDPLGDTSSRSVAGRGRPIQNAAEASLANHMTIPANAMVQPSSGRVRESFMLHQEGIAVCVFFRRNDTDFMPLIAPTALW